MSLRLIVGLMGLGFRAYEFRVSSVYELRDLESPVLPGGSWWFNPGDTSFLGLRQGLSLEASVLVWGVGGGCRV